LCEAIRLLAFHLTRLPVQIQIEPAGGLRRNATQRSGISRKRERDLRKGIDWHAGGHRHCRNLGHFDGTLADYMAA